MSASFSKALCKRAMHNVPFPREAGEGLGMGESGRERTTQ